MNVGKLFIQVCNENMRYNEIREAIIDLLLVNCRTKIGQQCLISSCDLYVPIQITVRS